MAKTKTAVQAAERQPEQAAPQGMPPMHLEVRVYPKSNMKNLLATANVNVNGCLAIQDFKVLTGKNGIYVGCPSKQMKNGDYRETVFPVTKEFREQLGNAILSEYHHTITQMNDAAQAMSRQEQENAVSDQEPEISEPDNAPVMGM